MNVLRDYHVQRLYALATEAGIARERLSWQDPKNDTLIPSPSATRPESRDRLLLDGGPYYFSIESEMTYCICSPGLSEMHFTQPVSSWSDVEARFAVWLGEAMADSVVAHSFQALPPKVKVEFSNQSLAWLEERLESLSFNPTQFGWKGDTRQVFLSYIDTSYFFQFVSFLTGENVIYTCTYSPTATVRGTTVPAEGWTELTEKLAEWLKALREDNPISGRPEPTDGLQSDACPLYLRSLKLDGVRRYGDFQVEFPEETKDVLIIGGNGTGKTTLLRALALMLVSPAAANQLLSSRGCSLMTQEGEECSISAEFENASLQRIPRSLVIERQQGAESVVLALFRKDPVFVVGFGSGRGMVGSTDRPGLPVQSLFSYDVQLTSLELLLRRLQQKQPQEYEGVLAAIVEFLGVGGDTAFELSATEGLMLVSGGHRFPFDAWADGYRLTTAFVVNLLAKALEMEENPGQFFVDGQVLTRGVLLIDEVEQHLHPKLQYSILRRLRHLFPNMLIVATTHSPIVLLGAEPQGIVSLKIDEDGRVRSQPVPETDQLSVLEVVESISLFDSPVYPPEWEAKLKRHKELKRLRLQRALSSDEEAEIRQLAQELVG